MKHTALARGLALLTASTLSVSGFAAEKLDVLLIDGQNNHKWQETTPLLVTILEETGRFDVTVATSPGKGSDVSAFAPSFDGVDVVVSNYNGAVWGEKMRTEFASYVREGGGFVSVHAANNAFPQWPEYNEMIGVGGWGGRNEKSGPYLRLRGKSFVQDPTPGKGGGHGSRHEFLVEVREPNHPIMKGLPLKWMHSEDELYDRLRGPAAHVTVLASAYSDPATKGTGEHEPQLMVVDYGKGRVFHTTFGHDARSIAGADFQVTLQRGTEWAATGDVTLPAPAAELFSEEAAVYREVTPAADAGGADEGFTNLFDGKTLEGWKQMNGTAKYTVDNGTIRGVTAEGSPNSFLATEDQYEDFELRFEVMVHDSLNSGVQIRSRNNEKGRFFGPQVEIEASPGQSGYVYGEATGLGWLSPEPQDRKHAHEHIRNGAWNQYRILAEGPRIQTWINGRKVADLTHEEVFKSHPKGHVGLQVHSIKKGSGPFDVAWRNVRIKELDESP